MNISITCKNNKLKKIMLAIPLFVLLGGLFYYLGGMELFLIFLIAFILSFILVLIFRNKGAEKN
jgi:uncharacterized membrane protein